MESTDESADLEKAFDYIKMGNEEEESNLWWEATKSFDAARQILKSLSIAYPSPETTDEHKKIAELYRQQSILYLHRSRKSIIRAMTEEHQSDEQISSGDNNDSSTLSMVYQKLSDEQCLARLSLFGRLFAKEINDLPVQRKFVAIDEQESALEGRLRELNSTLPSGLKSEEQRMRDINRGLGRLGLSLYSASDERNKPFGGVFSIEPPKSESEQVADIIAQARDEIAVLGPTSESEAKAETTEAGESTGAVRAKKSQLLPPKIDSDTDDDESDIENELDEDATDEPELTSEVCKEMQDKLADAQASLAELIAMFDVDSGGDAPIQFDQGSGKLALKRARISLLQVTKTWNDI